MKLAAINNRFALQCIQQVNINVIITPKNTNFTTISLNTIRIEIRERTTHILLKI